MFAYTHGWSAHWLDSIDLTPPMISIIFVCVAETPHSIAVHIDLTLMISIIVCSLCGRNSTMLAPCSPHWLDTSYDWYIVCVAETPHSIDLTPPMIGTVVCSMCCRNSTMIRCTSAQLTNVSQVKLTMTSSTSSWKPLSKGGGGDCVGTVSVVEVWVLLWFLTFCCYILSAPFSWNGHSTTTLL